jgi:uncharacterized membrane protein YvbJ
MVQGGRRKDYAMKVCPDCRTKNDDLTNFCKKCGLLLTGPAFKEKREKVVGERKKLGRGLIFFVVIVIILGGVAFWIIQAKTTTNPKIGYEMMLKKPKEKR